MCGKLLHDVENVRLSATTYLRIVPFAMRALFSILSIEIEISALLWSVTLLPSHCIIASFGNFSGVGGISYRSLSFYRFLFRAHRLPYGQQTQCQRCPLPWLRADQ